MRTSALAAGALALAVASVASAGGTRAIESGRIDVGRGVHGIVLGMTRAQVVARLGRPLYENANGYMQYSRRHLFDVYARGRPRRVDLVTAAGPRFCLPHRICTLRKRSLRRLLRAYGGRVRVELTAADPLEPNYVLRRRFRGRATNTAFAPGGGRLGQVYVAFAAPGEPVFSDPPRAARRRALPLDATTAGALRAAYCRDVVAARTCADPVFTGPLQGRVCLPLETGRQVFCDTYRACRLRFGKREWARAGFWLPQTGAEGTTTWFRRGRRGWRAYPELIVGRRLATALRC